MQTSVIFFAASTRDVEVLPADGGVIVTEPELLPVDGDGGVTVWVGVHAASINKPDAAIVTVKYFLFID